MIIFIMIASIKKTKYKEMNSLAKFGIAVAVILGVVLIVVLVVYVIIAKDFLENWKDLFGELISRLTSNTFDFYRWDTDLDRKREKLPDEAPEPQKWNLSWWAIRCRQIKEDDGEEACWGIVWPDRNTSTTGPYLLGRSKEEEGVGPNDILDTDILVRRVNWTTAVDFKLAWLYRTDENWNVKKNSSGECVFNPCDENCDNLRLVLDKCDSKFSDECVGFNWNTGISQAGYVDPKDVQCIKPVDPTRYQGRWIRLDSNFQLPFARNFNRYCDSGDAACI